MISVDDTLLCVLSSCEKDLSSKRLMYYMYVYQEVGMNFNFKYTINPDSVKSRTLEAYINQLMSTGYLRQKDDGILNLTEKGSFRLDSFVLSYDESEYLDMVQKTLDNLSTDDLHFFVLTDILISEAKIRYGVEGLVAHRAELETTLKYLSNEFTDDNFNNSIILMNKLKKGFPNNG